MLLLIISQISTTTLSIKSTPGYLAGSLNTRVSLRSTADLADTYKCEHVAKDKFYIEVNNMPGTYWDISGDKTLVYKFFGTTKDDNTKKMDDAKKMGDDKKMDDNKSVNTNVNTKKKMAFQVVNKNKEIKIMHNGFCLTYVEEMNHFQLEECRDGFVLQVFLAMRNGRVVDDFFIPDDDGKKELVVEE